MAEQGANKNEVVGAGVVSILSNGMVKEPEAKRLVAAGQFILVPVVVKGKKPGSTEFIPTYGFFILNKDGEIYDVYNSSSSLKTLFALKTVQNYVLELEPDRPWIALQPLNDEICATKGDFFEKAEALPNYKGWVPKKPDA